MQSNESGKDRERAEKEGRERGRRRKRCRVENLNGDEDIQRGEQQSEAD